MGLRNGELWARTFGTGRPLAIVTGSDLNEFCLLEPCTETLGLSFVAISAEMRLFVAPLARSLVAAAKMYHCDTPGTKFPAISCGDEKLEGCEQHS